MTIVVNNYLNFSSIRFYIMSNDIALLILNETVDVTSARHKAICLPQPGDAGPPINSTCVVTGWGAIGIRF